MNTPYRIVSLATLTILTYTIDELKILKSFFYYVLKSVLITTHDSRNSQT